MKGRHAKRQQTNEKQRGNEICVLDERNHAVAHLPRSSFLSLFTFSSWQQEKSGLAEKNKDEQSEHETSKDEQKTQNEKRRRRRQQHKQGELSTARVVVGGAVVVGAAVVVG